MDKLKSDLPEVLKRSIELASERGSWLTTSPIADFGFKLHKGAFRDEIALNSFQWHNPVSAMLSLRVRVSDYCLVWILIVSSTVTKFSTFDWMEVMWYEQIKSSNPVHHSSPVIQSSDPVHNPVHWLEKMVWRGTIKQHSAAGDKKTGKRGS